MNDEAKAKILVVDDEENIQNTLSTHFEFQGYEVKTASNGAEALNVLAGERVEVVITDIMMPVMNGVDLLREIKKRHPMIHVIIITGYVTLDNLLATFRLGADTFFYKPLKEMDKLDLAVENAVESLKDWQMKLKRLKNLKTD